jgi:hypothetical protein
MYSQEYTRVYNRVHTVYIVMHDGGEERLRTVTNCTYFIMDPLNVITHNVPVYKNVSTTLNEDLLYFQDQ